MTMCKDRAVFVFQGDSVTDAGRGQEVGPNVGLGGGYAMMAASRLLEQYPEKALSFYNRGFSGDRVSNLFERWRVDCLNFQPDYISILVGVNDSLGRITHHNGEDPKCYGFLYRSLLQWTKVLYPDVTFILCQPYLFMPEQDDGVTRQPVLDETREQGEIVRRLAAEFDGIFVPFFDELTKRIRQTGMSYYLRDRVHPQHAGHALLARIWLDAVTPRLTGSGGL
jgi:lysophospholipase L1-like esterase